MREFKDSKQGTWDLSLTFGAVVRIKKESDGKFDLLDPAAKDGDGRMLSDRMLNDLGEFWEVLWYLVKPVAAARGVTAEQFGELMAADCVHAAQDKFFREWSDFFQGLQRKELAIALDAAIETKAKSMKKLHDRIQAELNRASEQIDKSLDQKLNSEFGKLRDSLASILEP